MIRRPTASRSASHCDQHLPHRRADQHFQVARLTNGLSGHGHQPGYQRPSLINRVVYGRGGGHVVARHADIRRERARSHLMPGQHLDELVLVAHRIARGHRDYLYHAAQAHLRQRIVERGEGLGLVVLDADEAGLGVQSMAHDHHACDDVARAGAHQHVVAGDVWLALRPVQDERINRAPRPGIELDVGREARASQTHDAGVADTAAQHAGLQVRIVAHALAGDPLILAVGLDHDAAPAQPRRVRHREVVYGLDHAGAGGVHGRAHIAVGMRDHLPLPHALAHLHDGLGGIADVLVQGQDQLLGQTRGGYRKAGGLLLVSRQVQTAGGLPQLMLHG